MYGRVGFPYCSLIGDRALPQQSNEGQADGGGPQAQRPAPTAAGSLLNTVAVLLAVVAVMMIPILSQLNVKA